MDKFYHSVANNSMDLYVAFFLFIAYSPFLFIEKFSDIEDKI